MSYFKKLLFLFIAVTMILSIAACGGDDGEDSKSAGNAETSGETATSADAATESNTETAVDGTESEDNGSNDSAVTGDTVTVSIKTAGGIAMNGIDVFAYEDNTLTDLVQFGQTKEDGKASLLMKDIENKVFVLSGVPEGYDIKEYYDFDGDSTEVVLTSAPVADKDLSDKVFAVGDVIYDFSVNNIYGDTITLSEVLKEKELVVLNFWYTTCSWCITEFPVLDDVYQQYMEDVEVLALDPLDGATAVKNFAEQQQLSFTLTDCPSSWANSFSVTGYPTSVFIDRYGVICLIESGAITSNRPLVSAFEHFTADEYKQTLCEGIGDLVTEILPTVEFEGSDAVAEAINGEGVEITYRPETEDENAKLYWPFVTGEKNGESCIYASNKGIEDSYAILYADVSLEEGQAIGFDYISSTESLCDILYVIVNDQDIYQISGVQESDGWQTCYPWVAEKAGEYELALCYMKDGDNNEGDDTVYISNMRVVDKADIDVLTYIPRDVATLAEDGTTYEYAEIVLNEEDGYYHVGDANGPLLLADLMNITKLNEDKSVWSMVYEGDVTYNGESYYNVMVDYFSYASNSSLNGVCTVNAALAEQLAVVADSVGFDGTEEEWLKTCRYYQVYGGADNSQLADPIEGLATFSASDAVLGVDKEENYFYYDRAIIPRGMFKKFTPNKSGVYRITSHNESAEGVEGWIFDSNGEIIYTFDGGERDFNVEGECSMVYYMEAGVDYFINIAFWDLYETGYIYFDVEYIGASYDMFSAASPGYFTYDTSSDGDDMYYTISGGITPILKDDGFYYEDLGLDANGNQLYGSIIYADFGGITSIFDRPIASGYAYDENGNIIKDDDGNPVTVKGMIELGGFDFSKTEDDLYILNYLESNGGDADATVEYLKELWGESYDDYAESYQLEDVLNGKFHGEGEDYTEAVSAYVDKMISDGSQKNGCVPVDEELAEILQKLMDKYTFENVEYSWLKVCYYYQHFGA